ncbi:molybdenum cofactor guanylyltransferase [Campylobacter sp. MIT 99-7217]|nr:molybdenum cofactor guanylyltransferase [Campylobacter sp. MIT 99-7217]
MGFDKCFLKFQETDLIHFQYQQKAEIFEKVYLSVKEDKFQNEFKNLIFDECEDKTEFNPMLALFSILKQFHNIFVFILCVDMPNVGLKEILQLQNALDDEKIVYAKTPKHEHFLCGFYHSSLANLCLDFVKKKEYKIQALLKETKHKSVAFENELCFANLNYYKDYEDWKNQHSKPF